MKQLARKILFFELRICRKEGKRKLLLVETHRYNNIKDLEEFRAIYCITESTELMKIFGSILQ